MPAFEYFEYCMKSNQTSNQIQNGTRNSETFVSVSFALPPVKRRAKFNDFSRTIIERCVNCWLCCQEERERERESGEREIGEENLERAAAADANVDEKSVDYLERFERTNCSADQISRYSLNARTDPRFTLCIFLETKIYWSNITPPAEGRWKICRPKVLTLSRPSLRNHGCGSVVIFASSGQR